MRLEEKKNPKLTESLVFGHYRQFVSAENVNTQSNLCQKYSSSSPWFQGGDRFLRHTLARPVLSLLLYEVIRC